MSNAYGFTTQLRKGEAGERYLDRFFAERFRIRKATPDQQRHGIDRIFTDRENDGRIVTVEYKTDTAGGRTNNAFVETVSVDTARKPGWAYTSAADVLVYWLPELLTAYVIEMACLRSQVPRWVRAYPERAIPNEGYATHGVLVPLREFDAIATQVVSP